MKKYMETCAERLYPDIPSPALPPAVYLANHTGQYSDPGYGDLFVALKCGNESSTVTSLTTEDEGHCRLQVKTADNAETPLYVNLEHKTGNYWLGWGHIVGVDIDMPVTCSRIQFRVDDKGTVSHLGVDIRMEGDDAPLVWFKHVE
jgi:hypothetical protein